MAKPIGDLVPQSHLRSPRSGGDDGAVERSAQQQLRLYGRGQAQLLLRDPFGALYLEA